MNVPADKLESLLNWAAKMPGYHLREDARELELRLKLHKEGLDQPPVIAAWPNPNDPRL